MCAACRLGLSEHARKRLVESGVAVVDATLASSEDAAVAACAGSAGRSRSKRKLHGPVAQKRLGCVRLDCATESRGGGRHIATVVANAKKAGFRDAGVLIQPMIAGVAEAYAGIIDDPLYGPAIAFGLGGIFVEILKDTTVEMAPLSHDDALAMIHRLKAAPVLLGARGSDSR